MNVVSRASSLARSAAARRWMHATAARCDVTHMRMPAMSPTMKEGGIAGWKVKEGSAFSAGDVLLEIETDKATIDVEAQEDGILGKIILADGAKNIPVGKVIAILAEEGDDISNLEVPADEPAPPPPSAPSPAPSDSANAKPTSAPRALTRPRAHPTHARPLFPSVLRLLQANNVGDADVGKIAGTGVRGMLTKGDVLAFLGQASGPLGSYKAPAKETTPASASAPKKEEVKPLDGAAVRTLIVQNLLKASQPKPVALPDTLDFDSIIDDYLPANPATPKAAPSPPSLKAKSSNFLDGLI